MLGRTSSATRVLVLGSTGMLGQSVARGLELCGIEVVRTQRISPGSPGYLNAEDPNVEEVVDHLLRKTHPQYVINCAGVLKAEMDLSTSTVVLRGIRVNAVLPHVLARCVTTSETRVLHMSTDAVFSGTLQRPCVESDVPDAHDEYGKSKALGEVRSDLVLNIRCSIIGRDPDRGRGLLEWVLRAPAGSELTGYADQRWNGVTTDQFASLCTNIMQDECFDDFRAASHVIHFCPNQETTKYELLEIWQKATRPDIHIRPGISGWTGRLLASEHDVWRRVFPGSAGWESLLHSVATPISAS